jgi:hypothetical protein
VAKVSQRVILIVLISSVQTFGFSLRGSADDGLQQLRSETRGTGPDDPPPPPRRREPDPPQKDYQQPQYHFDEDDDASDSVLGTAMAVGLVMAASAPFLGPAKLIEDDYASPAFFPRYPYQMPLDGHLMIDPYVPRKPRTWAGRIQAEYGGDFEDLTALNGGVLLETSMRFGIDSWAHYYSQQVAPGRSDHLLLGDTNLLFRFAQSPKVEMRTGVGFNWLTDDIGSEFGFNFTYGGDWYPINPLIVSSELDWGQVGHASLFHARATVGVQYHRGELYVGYDYLDVGNAQLDSWVTGLRFWF